MSMDRAELSKFKLPADWIDRIFLRLTEIYGEKFTRQWTKPDYMDLAKLQWQSGLYGLTSDEIKKVLNLCLNGFIQTPPNQIEFYHYGKNYKIPKTPAPDIPKANAQTQKLHMEKIRGILNGSVNRQDSLSADSK